MKNYKDIPGTASWVMAQRFTDDKTERDNYLMTVERLMFYPVSIGDYVNVYARINKHRNYKGVIKSIDKYGILIKQKRRELLIAPYDVEDITVITKNVMRNVVDMSEYKKKRGDW